ncbi:unnamed protein product [Pylaiella littoralis]
MGFTVVRPGHCCGTTTLVLVIASAFFLAVAEQPSWGWNGNGPPPRGSAQQPQQPTDVGDAWYSGADAAGQDQWGQDGGGEGGEQYTPYAEEDAYGGYSSAPPPPPPPGGGGLRDRAGDTGATGGRISSSRSKARRRGKKRGRSGRGGSGGGRAGDEFDDEEGGIEGGDLVLEYMQSLKGKVVLSGGASVAGAALGAVISKSTIQRTPVMSLVGLLVGLILSVAKGAFGDLFRALGLASALAVTRSRRLSAEYPFLPYAKRALVMLPRRPFPPAENPWKYKRADALAELEEAGVADDGNLPAEFSMAKSLLCVAFLGGFAGFIVSQFPFVFLPTFMLALGGGGFLAYLATTRNARGDLTRLLGMRTVAFLGLVSEINSDVALSTKAKVVGGICFSKAMFWDSKYHIKDRVVVMLSNLYAAVVKLVGRVQREARDDDDDDGSYDGSSDAGGRAAPKDRERQPRSSGGSSSSRRRRRPAAAAAEGEPPMPTSPPPPPPPPSGYGGGGGGGGGNYQGGGGW